MWLTREGSLSRVSANTAIRDLVLTGRSEHGPTPDPVCILGDKGFGVDWSIGDVPTPDPVYTNKGT
jgi:hypothetical protein